MQAQVLEIQLRAAGLVQLRAQFAGVMRRTEDLKPVLEIIRDEFFAHMEAVFASEGAATRSGAWAALSPRYAKWKLKHYPGKTILRATDALYKSLTAWTPADVIEKDRLRIVSTVTTPGGRWNLGMLHQEGAPNRNVPARPLIDLSDAAIQGWYRRLYAYLRSEP